MDADERDIFNYLKSYPGQFLSGAEIARRAGGKWRYREEPTWADQVILRLLEKGIIESDSTGHYRLAPRDNDPRKKKKKAQQWVSPAVRKILEESGRFESKTFDIEEEEDELIKALDQWGVRKDEPTKPWKDE
jgi:hypothetical protein